MQINMYGFLLSVLLLIGCHTDNEVDPGISYEDLLPKDIEGVISDEFSGNNLILYANSSLGIIVAFQRETIDGVELNFDRSTQDFPNVFESDDGTIWNVFGKAISGTRKGDSLQPIRNQKAYWFSYSTLFPRVTLMGETQQERIKDNYANAEWLINPDKISSGAIKDGIPSIDNPKFSLVTNATKTDEYNVEDKDLVVVVVMNGMLKVYPYRILNWHEIVNDEIDGMPITVSYCPLTGTGAAWKRNFSGNVTTFGVSGLLYENNLIMYDRATDSLWPQILEQSVYGQHIMEEPSPVNSFEMTWEAAKMLSDSIYLLTEDTGYSRDYSLYPYGNYTRTEELLFPISYEDSRVFMKEKVLNVRIGDIVKSYRYSDFETF